MKKLLLSLLCISNMILGQNCPALLICNNVVGTPNGFGVQELNAGNRGCLTANEHNSIWYTVTIGSSGTLEFEIDPGTKDYDFAVWGPNSPCPPTGLPLRCSFSANAGQIGGLRPAVDFTEGPAGDGWVAPINALIGQTYLILVDRYIIPGGSGAFSLTFTGTASIICSPLPIELSTFECVSNTSVIGLNWTTMSEVGNSHFEIERSSEGLSWQYLGTVLGAGNSSNINYYSFIDNYPNEGVNYYRLKQVDYNATFSYSFIVSCESTQFWSSLGYYNLLGQKIQKPESSVYLEVLVNVFGEAKVVLRK